MTTAQLRSASGWPGTEITAVISAKRSKEWKKKQKKLYLLAV